MNNTKEYMPNYYCLSFDILLIHIKPTIFSLVFSEFSLYKGCFWLNKGINGKVNNLIGKLKIETL